MSIVGPRRRRTEELFQARRWGMRTGYRLALNALRNSWIATGTYGPEQARLFDLLLADCPCPDLACEVDEFTPLDPFPQGWPS